MDDLVALLKLVGEGTALENYIIPGLRSTMLAKPEAGGCIRRFDMLRDQEVDVTPHDHRYDFKCLVLAGEVRHRRYHVYPSSKDSADYAALPYNAETHELDTESPRWLAGGFSEEVYKAGAWYGCTHHEFHSIRFSNRCAVLFWESAQRKGASSCLLPYFNGRICNTFTWREWMMAPAARAVL